MKIKLRQVNSAREVQQRKEREAERQRLREEEQRIREERRAREEALKKERGEKAAQERAEKAERARIKEEERKAKADREKREQQERELEKEQERERQKEERLRKDQERIQERERAKLEKERDRERLRKEKEQRALDQKRLAEEEKRKKEEFAKEMERVEKARKEAEREKEAERVKARVDMENLIAEREKARQEKANSSSAAGTSSGDAQADGKKAASNCMKCCQLIDGSSLYFAIGHCNHRTICSLCVLRMRTSNFGCQTWTCVECNSNLDHVVCTSSSKSFSKFQLPGNPGPDLTYDKKSRMFFPKDYYKATIEELWKFTCIKCGFGSADVDVFKKHIGQNHNESLCDLCLSSERIFHSEVITYTQEELEKHMQGSPSSSGHPSCRFCQERFVNVGALAFHLFETHKFCKICNPDLRNSVNVSNDGKVVIPSIEELMSNFFSDHGDLLAHCKSEHFVCLNFSCRDQAVVFKTEEELKAHSMAYHSSSWNLKTQTPSYSAQQPSQMLPPQYPSLQTGLEEMNSISSHLPSSQINGLQPGSRQKKWGNPPPPPPPPPPSTLAQSSSSMPWATVAAASSNKSNRFGNSALDSFDTSSGPQYSGNRSTDSDEFPPSMMFNIKAAEFKPSGAPTPPLDHSSSFVGERHSSKFVGYEDTGDVLGVTEMLGSGLSGLGSSLLSSAVRGASLGDSGQLHLPPGLGSLDTSSGVGFLFILTMFDIILVHI